MEKLKSFEEFKKEQQMNEGIFDALKSVMKFFKGVSKTLQTNIGNFTKKLDNSKTWQDTLTNINSMVIQPNIKYFEDGMKSATSVSQIRKINYEVHSTTFTELNATYKKWDGQNQKSPISPSAIFVGTPFANMYNFNDTEKFIKNLPNAINALVTTFAKTTGYPMDDVTKSINEYKDLTQNPPEQKTETPPDQNKQGTGTGTENKQGTENNPTDTTNNSTNNAKSAVKQNSNDTSAFDSYNVLSYNNFMKILEQGENAGGNSPEVKAPEANNNQQQPATDNQQKPADNNQQNQQPIDKLKTENINNFKNNFYGIMQKKLKAFKPTAENTGTGVQKDVQDIAKTMTGSGQNVDSKKKLLKAMADPKITAGQMADIRDAIAKILNIDKPEETIGKF